MPQFVLLHAKVFEKLTPLLVDAAHAGTVKIITALVLHFW